LRVVNSVSDLSFGEYVRFFEPREKWEQFGIKLGRDLFLEKLKVVNRIRNDVMHNRGAAEADVIALQKFARLLDLVIEP